jgi:hypothetical protein
MVKESLFDAIYEQVSCHILRRGRHALGSKGIAWSLRKAVAAGVPAGHWYEYPSRVEKLSAVPGGVISS